MEDSNHVERAVFTISYISLAEQKIHGLNNKPRSLSIYRLMQNMGTSLKRKENYWSMSLLIISNCLRNWVCPHVKQHNSFKTFSHYLWFKVLLNPKHHEQTQTEGSRFRQSSCIFNTYICERFINYLCDISTCLHRKSSSLDIFCSAFHINAWTSSAGEYEPQVADTFEQTHMKLYIQPVLHFQHGLLHVLLLA